MIVSLFTTSHKAGGFCPCLKWVKKEWHIYKLGVVWWWSESWIAPVSFFFLIVSTTPATTFEDWHCWFMLGCFGVSIIHRTLTCSLWTAGSRTFLCDLFACVYKLCECCLSCWLEVVVGECARELFLVNHASTGLRFTACLSAPVEELVYFGLLVWSLTRCCRCESQIRDCHYLQDT